MGTGLLSRWLESGALALSFQPALTLSEIVCFSGAQFPSALELSSKTRKI